MELSENRPTNHDSETAAASANTTAENGENSNTNRAARTMDGMESVSLGNFKVLYVLAQLIGATLIVLMICWIKIHLNGFGWTENPSLEFNWHPLLMTIGMIFLYGNSILIYRGFRQTRKKKLKLLHASIHLTAFILIVIALIAVFDSHNLKVPPIPNLYSLHSWLGLATVILFSLQWVGGFVAYLLPVMKQNLRETIMPYHIYFGLTGFVMAIATVLMGLSEKAFFIKLGDNPPPNTDLMVNFMGVLTVLFGIIVVYLTTERSYKRLPLPEDAILLTGANE